MKGRTYRYMTQKPLYPFGYGLSYSTYTYKDAKLSAVSIEKDQPVTLMFKIENKGAMDGEEVAQVYLKNPNDPEGPLKALKAFRRVPVKAGESAEVSIELKPESFRSFNDRTQTFEVRPGEYTVLLGSSSDDRDLQGLKLTIQ